MLDKKLSFLHYVVVVVRLNLRTVFNADKINWDLVKAESLGKHLISLREIALQLVPGPWN